MTAPALALTPSLIAHVVRCLHNNTRALGMGALHDLGREMTQAEALETTAGHRYFDYVSGRPLKVSFERAKTLDEVDGWLYIRDASQAAWDRALASAVEAYTAEGGAIPTDTAGRKIFRVVDDAHVPVEFDDLAVGDVFVAVDSGVPVAGVWRVSIAPRAGVLTAEGVDDAAKAIEAEHDYTAAKVSAAL